LSRIEFNIVALGDFSSVNAQLKAFQAQVDILQKGLSGVGLSSTLQKDLINLNSSFKQTLLSTGQFTESTVKMSSETARFGDALVSGKLKLSEYYGIISQKSTQAVAQIKALALEQTKLQNSIVVSDPTKQGVLSVYTPTAIDKVANATKLAANEQNLYNIAVAKGSQELINWGKNTQWAGRQLTVGMSVPLMIFGQQAVSSFKDVNIELTRLQRLYGEGLTPPSQAQLDEISGQVINLGKQIASSMGIAQTETVKAAANFAAMGRQGKDLLDTTAQTMRLSKLGAVSTADATNTVVALQNVYKVSTYQLADAVNFLSDIQKQTTMTLGDMTQAIPRVGPIMQQLGGTYKDTAVMLVAMREAGIPAAQAANAVKSAVASMIAPTSAASKEFAQYGINLTSIKDNTQGNPVKMLEALQAGMSKLSPLVKEQLIEKLFGKFQFARISALLDNFGKVGSQTVNALKIAGATSGELATLANQEMKQATSSPTAQYQRALETFKADLVPVGQKIIEFTTKLMNFANTIAKVFSGLPGPVKAVMGAVAVGVVLAGPIIMLTGLLANFVGYLVKGIFNLKQLATGGKTIGQLLTPELIAAQNANKIFNSGIIDDVKSIDLLATAIQDLTMNLKEMVATLNMGTNVEGLIQTIGGAATTEKRIYSQMHVPGFAKGLVPGSGDGSKDTFPAMLAPGEAVIPASKVKKYYPFVQAMIEGNLPGYMAGAAKVTKQTENYGTTESGEPVWLSEPHGQSTSGTGLSGSATMISEMSGDAEKIPGIIRESVGEFQKIPGLIMEVSEAGMKQLADQSDLAHRSMGENTPEDQKIFKASQLYGVSHAENAPMSTISELYSKEGTSKDTDVVKAKRDYMDKIINSAAKEIEGITPEEVAGFKAGNQAVTEAEQKLYQSVLDKVLKGVEDTARGVSGASSPFVTKTKAGYKADGVVSQMVGARAAGRARLEGRAASVEDLQLSKYIEEDKSTPAALTAFKKSTTYDTKTGRRDASSINNSSTPDVALEKTLRQRLVILKKYKIKDEQAIRETQISLTRIEAQNAALRMKQLEKQKLTETEEYKKLGKMIAQGAADGIISELPKASESSLKFINGMLKEMESTAEVHSPSRLFKRKIGKPIGEGVVQGVKESMAAMGGIVEEEITFVANMAGKQTKPWWMVGEKYGQAATQGLVEATQLMLPGIDKVNAKVINKFKSNGSELHALMLTSAGQIVNDQIPIFAEGGAKIATAFKAGVEIPIRSIGSDIHEELIASMLEVSGMTKESYAAGMTQGEAFKAGYKQGELGFNVPVQEAIPGLEKAGIPQAPGIVGPSEKPYGPLMENGGFTQNSGMLGKIKGKLITPEGKMSMGAKMGASTAMMMGGQMLTSMLPKGSNVANIAGSVSSMAGMGMMFGPWGAAAGAALGLVTGGIGALMKAEKEHQATVKATFTASTSAIAMFGGTVQDTTPRILHMADALTSAGITSKKTISEINQLTDAIAKMDKNDPTKKTADAIKGYDSVGGVVGTLKQFAAAQVAAGMDPAGVQKMVTAMLQYAGKTQYLNAALKEIIPATASAGKAQETLLKKVVAAGNATYLESQATAGLGNSYNALNADQKNVADGFGTVATSLMSATATSAGMKGAMDALNSSGLSAAASGQFLALELQNMGQDKNFIANFNKINGVIKNTGAAMLISEAQAMGLKKGLDSVALTKLASDPKAMAQLMKDLEKANAEAAKLANDGKPTKTNSDGLGGSTATFTGTAQEKAIKKQLEAKVKSENTILKTLKDQLTVEKQKAAEVKRQMDYNIAMQSLNQQSKEALISGNYLQAAMLGQQAKGATVDFNATTKENIMQGKMDTIQARTDVFSQALSDLNDAIANGVKTINKSISNAVKLPTLRGQDVNVNSAGVTVNVAVQTSGADNNALAAAAAKAAHEHTLKALKTHSQKNGAGNKITTKSTVTPTKANSGLPSVSLAGMA
jgi:TP901 family phage tail tape measure protein